MINNIPPNEMIKSGFPITRLFFFLVSTLVIISFLLGCLFVLDRDALPIASVYIKGNLKYINVSNIQSKVEENISAGLLYLDTRKIRNILLVEPWVEDVFVRKIWPPGLQVRIIEKTPVAKWGEGALLSSNGAVFKPKRLEDFNDLVTLFSPLESPKRVTESFLVAKKFLDRCGIGIKHFGASDRGEWMVATIDEKKIHLGRGEITSKLLRFQYAYERELNAYWSEVKRIDLRYPNSLSVDKGQIKETRGLL